MEPEENKYMIPDLNPIDVFYNGNNIISYTLVAKKYNLTRERIRQICKKCIKKICKSVRVDERDRKIKIGETKNDKRYYNITKSCVRYNESED